MARGERVSLWRRGRSLKLAPLGRPKVTASAAQAPPHPLPVGQKDRLRQAARPPPRLTGRSSTAACASVRGHASQSKTARRGLLLQSARVGSPRAQQHGGVRVCMAPRQQPEHNSTAACASAGAAMAGSQSTAARRRALLSGATSARANQHGGVCFHRARLVGPGPPSLSLRPWVAFFVPCFVPAAPGAARRNARLGSWAPFGPVWPRPAPRGSRPHASAGATARWRARMPSAFFLRRVLSILNSFSLANKNFV